MACIQPFYLHLPNYTEHNGRISPVTGNREMFGVLALFHETKTAKPGVTFFLAATQILLINYCVTICVENRTNLQLCFTAP
jgi:hypothetical protein